MGKHALVVGGTGMLKDVSLWLEREGYHVSVVGRRKRRLDAVVQEAGSRANITAVSVDYHDDEAFCLAIEKTIDENGPVTLVVSWIHSSALNALAVLDDAVSTRTVKPWRLFHVRGSTAYLSKVKPSVSSNCLYRQVLLGFVLEETVRAG